MTDTNQRLLLALAHARTAVFIYLFNQNKRTNLKHGGPEWAPQLHRTPHG